MGGDLSHGSEEDTVVIDVGVPCRVIAIVSTDINKLQVRSRFSQGVHRVELS